MIILFIDDEQPRHTIVDRYFAPAGHTIIHAYTFDEAIKVIQDCQEKIDLAMFDHDLKDFVDEDSRKVERTGATIVERTGATIVRHMLQSIPQDKWPVTAIVHSHNHEPAKWMVHDLNGAGITATYMPFSADLIKSLVKELVV